MLTRIYAAWNHIWWRFFNVCSSCHRAYGKRCKTKPPPWHKMSVFNRPQEFDDAFDIEKGRRQF